MADSSIVIFSDGGARGNPGNAACAYVIYNGKEIIKRNSKYLGKATNNIAEYSGVVEALTGLLSLGYVISEPFDEEIIFKMDSELVVKQLGGSYKIKNPELKKLADHIKKIISDNKLIISFHHVPRAQNKLADNLVNEKLDDSSRL